MVEYYPWIVVICPSTGGVHAVRCCTEQAARDIESWVNVALAGQARAFPDDWFSHEHTTAGEGLDYVGYEISEIGEVLKNKLGSG